MEQRSIFCRILFNMCAITYCFILAPLFARDVLYGYNYARVATIVQRASALIKVIQSEHTQYVSYITNSEGDVYSKLLLLHAKEAILNNVPPRQIRQQIICFAIAFERKIMYII